jgi:dTDP-4-amino-4,6-dideoxygalactose transaminase
MQTSNPIRFPVLRPLLPTADKLLPYLEKIDANRWYTNLGPLVAEFETGLAQHFSVPAAQIVTSSNATMALSQTLCALVGRKGYCVMPSWTFVATPAAAIWAGLQPFFVDVDPATWLVMPEQILDIAKQRQVDAVIVTAAFGAGLDLTVWDRFTASTGIPVVIDAAAGFDGFAGCGAQKASTPVVVSLHATKVSGIGEGAVVITGDAALAKRIRRFGNFGFHGSRDALVAGTNAKMSEYSAAIGLAFLAEWPERRAGWADLSAHFAAEVATMPGLRLAPAFDAGWVSSYGLIELPHTFTADVIADELRQCGIETRKWWGEGCHLQSAYRACERMALPETERLGRQVLGLPFWLGLPREDVTEIFKALRLALQRI